MADNATVIREFVAAWSRLDVDELVAYFTEDGIYHNMPAGPVQGTENLKAFIAGFTANWKETDWEMVSLTASGDTVVAERIDRTLVGDVKVDLPCCGVFEMADGKIRVWRDYFDLNTYMKDLG